MIDVNKITSTLAKLPDAQLQQYAQMHKNDPYIMALAMSESNRRKELRDAAPAQQGMQEQPKVVDQMVAEMAPQQMPEETGIGRLPTGDMNFANGGIVAFAGGGDVERYQAGGMPYDPYAYGYNPLSAEKQQEIRGRAVAPQLTSMKQDIVAQANFKKMNGLPLTTAEATALAQAASPTSAAVPVSYDPTENLKKIAQTNAKYVAPAAPTDEAAALAQRYPKPRTGEAAPTVDTGRKAPAAAPAAGPTMSGGLASLDLDKMTADALKAAEKQPNPFAKDIEAVGSDKVKAKEAEVTGLEAIQKQFNDIYKGRKERLDAKEGEIAKMGNQTLGLSLLQAGAAMMSTPGGIGMALGKGVDVGSKQYIAGLDKINAAKEKLSDARDRLEEIEAQRGELSAREMFKARNEVKNTQISAKEDLIKANMQMYNVNRETALKMVDNKVRIASTVYEQEQQNARSAAQIKASLNTPDRVLWDQLMAKNGNDAVKALEAFKLAKGDKFDVRSSYADYLKAFAGKEGLTPPMSMGAYAGQFGATLPR